MDKFWWRAAWGLCLVQLNLAQIDLNITCRLGGVFHVEKNGRYSISRTEAADLCKAFNATLPTMAQMEYALSKGFETCRYGFIEGHVVIPRIKPNSICAANNTGVYILTSNISHYDTYCFNASAPLDKEDCTSVTDLPNSFEGQVTITIVNRDGTRYSKKGEYRTHEEDINPSSADYDGSSGSPGERSTSGGYSIFHTHLPTAHPTPEQANTWLDDSTLDTIMATTALMSTSDTSLETASKRQEAQDWLSWLFPPSESQKHLPMTTQMAGTDSNTVSAGWEPTEDNEDDRDKQLSFSGSGIDDDEDFISSTNIDRNGTSAQGENRTQDEQPSLIHHQHQDEEETPHSTSTITTSSTHNSHASQGMTTQSQEDISWTDFFDPISHPMGQGHQTERTDMDASHSTVLQPTTDPNTDLEEDLDKREPLSMTTQQSHSQSFATSPGEMEEEKRHPTTSTATSSNRHYGRGGRKGGSPPEDSTASLEGHTPHYPDMMENTTLIPVTPVNTGAFGEAEVTVVGESESDVDGSLSGDQGEFLSSDRDVRPTHGSTSSGHSRGSQEGKVNTTSGPIRRPQIPEWLIILASLLALALILAVCIAVNSRRRCGQKKKLVINNGNGMIEDRKPSGLNGEASKSQEMVHLVNKEPSETPDQFMTADETRNLQSADVKIGV